MGEALSAGFGHVEDRNPSLTQSVQCVITSYFITDLGVVFSGWTNKPKNN